jgi:cysteine-rich repeat protein
MGGPTNVHGRAGEEICNIDGALGLVLPMPDSDWIAQTPPLKQYPINACQTFEFGKPLHVFTCAIRGTKHSGECPNGDSLLAGGCMVPIDTLASTSQCVATKASVSTIQVRPLGNPDGRIYNIHMRDGTIVPSTIGYLQYQIPSIGISLDMVGGYSRIHQVQTIYGAMPPNPQACQLADMSDQIGCLVQADPCSVGYAGAGAKSFALRNPTSAPGTAQPIDAVRVAQIAPSTATVQALGTAGEYQLARKLYLVSLPGFNHVGVSGGDPLAGDELTLAQFAGIPANINAVLTANGFTTLGSQSPAGLDTQFCEDFNEQMVCNPTPASPSTLPANVNGCAGNPMGIPTVSTTCGNGVREAYEECDDGLNNGTASDHCSTTCRCVFDLNTMTGNCN